MEGMLTTATELTAARFLGEVRVRRDGDVVTVTGRRARHALYSWRERIGGALLLAGSAAMVVAASAKDATQATLAAGLILAAVAVYVIGYPLLWWTAQDAEVSFDHAAVNGIEIRTVGIGLLRASRAATRARRVSFNVIDERLRTTGYDLLVTDDDELVHLAGLLARKDGASTLRM